MDEQSDIYKEVHQFFDKDEKLGNAVSSESADLIKSGLRNVMGPARERDFLDSIRRPSNCDTLLVPKTNPPVWREIRQTTKEQDVIYQRFQAIAHKGIVPLVRPWTNSKQSTMETYLWIVRMPSDVWLFYPHTFPSGAEMLSSQI